MGRPSKEQLRKRKRNAYENWRYKHDPEYRAKKIASNKKSIDEGKQAARKRWRYKNDPAYKEKIKQDSKRHRARLRKMGLTTRGKPPLSKRERNRIARANLVKLRARIIVPEGWGERMGKISRERWAAMSKEERAEKMRPMQQKAQEKRALLRKIKSIIGKEGIKALKSNG